MTDPSRTIMTKTTRQEPEKKGEKKGGSSVSVLNVLLMVMLTTIHQLIYKPNLFEWEAHYLVLI